MIFVNEEMSQRIVKMNIIIVNELSIYSLLFKNSRYVFFLNLYGMFIMIGYIFDYKIF